MSPLATIGALIEVSPQDDVQHWPNEGSAWSFIDDHTPFRFRVAGELFDEGVFFGLQGPVEFGPTRYLNLICNIMLRYDNSDWRSTTRSGASFKVAPSVAQRVVSYDPAAHDDVPFYLHPEGTIVEGYPRVSRYGGIHVVEEPRNETFG